MDLPPSQERSVLSQTQQYVAETGFPNSSGRIRAHLRDVFKRAIPQDSSIVKIVCDSLCSVGHLKNNAIPRSDVDGLMVFSEGIPSKEKIEEVSDRVGSLINRRLVDLPKKYTMARACYVDASVLESIKHKEWETLDDNEKERRGLSLKALIHGTTLYEKTNSPIVTRLNISPLGKTIPQPRSNKDIDSLELRKSKYKARLYLHDNFHQMSLSDKDVVVKAMMQARREVVSDPLDLSVLGKDSETLKRLADLGLFVIDGQNYFPTWIYGL